MLTSFGRYLSKACISGALQEVWPPTIAPTLVAAHLLVQRSVGIREDHTRAESLHDRINVLCLNTVNDEVAAAGHKMASLHNLNVGLAQSQYAFIYRNIQKCYPTKSLNSSTSVSNLSGRSQAWTLERHRVSDIDYRNVNL